MRKSGKAGWYQALLCVLVTAAAILLCLCVEAVEERYYLKWDISPDGVSKLSDYTLNRLSALEESVTLYPVYSAGCTSQIKDLQQETLLRMSAVCPRVRVEALDPAAQPQAVAALAGEAAGVADGTVFVRNEAGTRVIRVDAEDFLFSQRIGEDVYTIYCGEAMLIGAIDRACDPNRPTWYYLTGHGEATAEDCARLTLQLTAMGMEVQSGAVGGITPQPGDVLAIFAPRADLTEHELLTLTAFVDGGGRLMLACGADAPLERMPNLRRLCDVYGLGYRAGWVVEHAEESARYVDRPEWLSPTLETAIPVKGRLILPRACALTTPALRPGVSVETLLSTSPRARLRADATATRDDASDETGRYPLAALASVGEGWILQLASECMLLDSADVSGASVLDASENLAFLAACVERMTDGGSGATLDAGVRQLPNQLIQFDSEQTRRRVSGVFLCAIPGALLATMLVVLLRRRRM